MTKDEMKNRISMALKDPILQQGFEIICKEIATLKEDYRCLEDAHKVLNELYRKLEKENERLTVSYETLKLHDEEEIGMLKSENAELKGLKDVATLIRANNDTVVTLMQLNNKLVSKSQQLTTAKKLIKNIIRVTWGEGWSYSLDWKGKAEQFLNSELQSKWINPARTTNDNEIKLNSEVDKCQSQKKH